MCAISGSNIHLYRSECTRGGYRAWTIRNGLLVRNAVDLGGHYVVSDSVLDQFGAAFGTKHFHHAVLMISHSSWRHLQDDADFLHHFAFSQQLQHFTLSVGEAFLFLDQLLILPSQAIDRVPRQTL